MNSTFQPGDHVRYRNRLFVVVRAAGDQVVLRDDEGETMTVRAASVRPA